jgi:hypothetical protein
MNNRLIDIIERFQWRHALQEEREMKNSHALSIDCSSAPSAPSQEGVRSTPRGVLENLPHVK